jgi:hypothetical protein
MDKTIRPFWPPLAAGLALGLVLLLTFLFTGHGLGATGFTTRLTAWLGGVMAPEMAAESSYLGGLLEDGKPLSNWITWQVVGVILGALLASWSAGRFKLQVDGSRQLGYAPRLILVLAGGILAGFGARLAAGCTSGMGLSGGATLAVAGFLFLGGFFATGLIVSRLLERVRYELTHNGREK